MTWISQLKSIKHKLGLFQANAFSHYIYIPRNSESTIIPWFYFHLKTGTMDASQYWPFAWKYSIWNAAVAALQFWTDDLKPHVLSHVIDWDYTAFFYSDHAQQIWNLSDKILFSCFMTTLKDTFERELTQEDEGYESRSVTYHIPTPFSRALRAYYVSMMDALSFIPVSFGPPSATPEHHAESSPHRNRSSNLTYHWLVFTNSDDESPMRSSNCHSQHSSSDERGWDSQRNRYFIFCTSQLVSLCHTHLRPVPHWSMEWCYHFLQRTFPNSTFRWWCLGWRTNSG